MVTKSAIINGGGLQSLAAAIGKPNVKARAVQLVASGAGALIGGADLDPGTLSPVVPSSNGFPIPQTNPLYLPYSAVWTDLYDFAGIFVYVPGGVEVSVLYENS